MIPYKSKAMHVEDDIINSSHIKNNRNQYHSKLNNCGNDFSMLLIHNEHLGDTIIAGNTDISIHIIMEIRYLVLSYIHIGLHTGDAKYSI